MTTVNPSSNPSDPKEILPISQQPWFKWLMIGAIVLLIIVSSSWWWLLQASSLGLLWKQPVNNPLTAMFVSKQAPVMVSLQTNPDRLEGLRETIITPSQRRSSHQQLIELEKQLLKPFGLNYQDDIASWLGDEITWAMTTTDYDRIPENGLQPGYIAILSSRNHVTSEEAIANYWRRYPTDNASESNEIYQGVKFNYNPQLGVASGIVGKKYVIFANHPQVLKNAINNAQSKNLSIIANTDYQQVIDHLPPKHIGNGYINFNNLQPILGSDLATKNQILGFSFQLKSVEIITKILLLGDNSPAFLPQINQTQEIIKYLPSEASLAIASTNLANLNQQLSTISPLPMDNILNQGFQWLNNLTQIDIQKKLLPWVTGEYGIAMLPNPKEKKNDWVFIAQRTNPQQIDQFIQDLDRLVQKQGYEVRPIPWVQYQVTGWTKLVTTNQNKLRNTDPTELLAQVSGVHTTIGDYEILASSVPSLGRVLTGWGESLRQNPTFKSALNQVPPETAGYFYLDWREIEPLLSSSLKKSPHLSKLLSVLFNPLNHQMITSYRDRDGNIATTIISQ